MISDLDVFMNRDEFGEIHRINGRDMTVMVDNDRLMERSKNEYDGISVGELMYFVRKEELGKRPEEGASQIFDGRQMYVFSCREDNGLYEVILSQNRGG